MKTIEKEAKEKSQMSLGGGVYYTYPGEKAFVEGFKSGAKFAQRWISVEDELPEKGDIILVKTDNGCIATAYLHGIKSGFITYGEDAYVKFGTITHWRPIELK